MINNIIHTPNIQLSTFNFQNLSLKDLQELLPDNGTMYNNQLEKFTAEHRKREWLAVRVLLYNMTGETKQILYEESGKPYLEDNSFFISLSHTRGYVAIILSEHHRVGVDIETTGERALKLAHKFVDDTELTYPETNLITKADMLTMIWSAKETMYKCMDSRKILFREELHVDVNIPLFEQPYFPAYETHTPQRQEFRIYYVYKQGEFVLTWTYIVES